MAFSATSVTVTVNSVAKVLLRINPGVPYGGEFYLREATMDWRLEIRHSEESLKKGELDPMQRHYISLTQTIFATSTTPKIVRQMYYIQRNAKYDDLVSFELSSHGLVDFIDGGTVLADLENWMS